MRAELTRLELRIRRRSALAYALGTAAYAALIVALYPSFRDDPALDRFTQGSSATVAALFGASGSLTSPTGWIDANLYGNVVPLILLLIAIGYGAQAIAGQSEDGTLGPLLTLPVTRGSVLTQKVIALAALVLPTAVVVMIGVVFGRFFGLTIGFGALVGVTIGSLLLALDLGLLAMLIGAVSGSRAVALGFASALALVGYVLSSLAPVVSWLRPARYASLFYYATGAGQLDQPHPGYLAVLAVVALLIGAATSVAFARMDVL
jgi:ABC-2 type transport system permease protein